MDIPFDTYTLKYHHVMQKALNALSNYGIGFFQFARRFKNAPPFYIGSSLKWHIRYIQKEYYKIDSILSGEAIKKWSYIYIWDNNFPNKKEQEMHEERTVLFGIPYGISLINRTQDFTDTYSFSVNSSRPNKINALLEIRQQLYDFAINFIRDNSSLIKEHYRKHVIPAYNIPLTPPKNFSEKRNVHIVEPHIINSPIENILYNYGKIMLTQRQIEYIYCVAQGLTNYEVSNVLNVSEKTVESMLIQCRIKLNCLNKCQMAYLSAKFKLIPEFKISPKIKEKIKRLLLTKT